MKVEITSTTGIKIIECDKFDVDGYGNLYFYRAKKIIAIFPKAHYYSAIDISNPPEKKGRANAHSH